jgi:hypothetical protein
MLPLLQHIVSWVNKNIFLCTSCKNLEHSDLDISLDSSFVDFTCVTTLEDDSDSEQDTDLEEDQTILKELLEISHP